MTRWRNALIFVLVLLPVCLLAVEVNQKGNDMTEGAQNSPDELLQKADSVFQSREYQAALEEYMKVATLAKQEFNRSVEVEALSQVARMNLILGNKDEGREWLGKAAGRASDTEPMGWSRYLGVKGRFEWKDDDLKTARETFDEMYMYCNTNALWSRAVDAAHMIAIVAETPDEQIKWNLRGIEAAESAGDESWLGPLWNNLACTYYDFKRFDEALDAYLKAREYHWKHSGEIAKLFADYSVGMTYRLLGKLDKAQQWLRPVLAWAERLENHSVIGQALQDLGEIEISNGNTTEGLAMIKRARDEYKLEGFDESWKEVWDGINTRIAELEK